MGRAGQIRCHGEDRHFTIMADFSYEYYGKNTRYVADVAGGQGLLSRLLAKRYN